MRRAWANALAAGIIAAGVIGAAWAYADDARIAARRNFWSFKKPVRPPATSIDELWLAQLREKSLTPAPAASREALIRRLTLDLTGLPPKPAEIDLFLADKSADAYEKLVDRLMGSAHYGERWAQRWLDVVRYADTNGFELDEERPHAWRYRDYVVRAFNSGKPYDRFIKEQVAGDELYPGNREALIATGFHRAGPIHLVAGNQDEELNRQEVLTEMTGTVANGLLGLTLGCARCHDHKFDPILQSDYYRLQAIFGATEGKDIVIASDAEKAAAEAAKKAHEEKLKPIKDEIKRIEKPYRDRLIAEKKTKLGVEHLAALAKEKDHRNAEEKRLAKEAQEQIDPTWDEVLALIPEPEKTQRAELRRKMHDLELDEPEPVPTAYAVANMEKPLPTHILKVGDHRMKLGEVQPGLPLVLTAPDASFPNARAGRRSALAEWLASPDNPLTARVMVNRIWQFRMGSGLVATPNDFGTLGTRPSNPKMLDWLATEFVARGWSVRAIDRQIVLSRAYRQSAEMNAANAKIDPENKYYWRMNRRRLDAEAIRDSMLAVSGEINLRAGGPPVRVPIEKEIYDLIFTEHEPDNLWPLPRDPREHYRRSLYLLNKRTVRLPMMTNFDQPDTMTSCPARPTSTHALQALSLMNSEFAQDRAKAFAARLEKECGRDRNCAIRNAYRVALGRRPSPGEIAMAQEFFAKKGQIAEYCLAMMNRNEFVYAP